MSFTWRLIARCRLTLVWFVEGFYMSALKNTLRWVTPKRFSELTGYTVKAVNNKIDSGVWRYGKLWTKGPDNRRLNRKYADE